MGLMLRNLVIGLLSAGLLGGGSAAAAQGSLPGDALYGVKQATEEVRLAAARSDADKAELHLAFAERRASEATELAQRGKSQEAHEAAEGYQKHVAAVGAELEQQKVHGKDVEKLVAKFQEHLKRHEATMTRVLDQVPDQAKGAIQRAMEVSRRGQEQAIRAMQAEKPGRETAPGQQAGPAKGGSKDKPSP